jgi:hypothetical protein
VPILLYIAMWSCILGMASHQEKPTTVGAEKKDTQTKKDL